MNNGLKLQSILSKNPKVVGQHVEQEVVLVLLEKNQVKVLNEVGSRIWDLVNGERSIAEISDVIFKEFEVAQQQSQDDVIDFLQELYLKGIVSVRT